MAQHKNSKIPGRPCIKSKVGYYLFLCCLWIVLLLVLTLLIGSYYWWTIASWVTGLLYVLLIVLCSSGPVPYFESYEKYMMGYIESDVDNDVSE